MPGSPQSQPASQPTSQPTNTSRTTDLLICSIGQIVFVRWLIRSFARSPHARARTSALSRQHVLSQRKQSSLMNSMLSQSAMICICFDHVSMVVRLLVRSCVFFVIRLFRLFVPWIGRLFAQSFACSSEAMSFTMWRCQMR